MKRKLIAILIASMTIGSAQPVLAMEGTKQESAQESAVQEESEEAEGAEAPEETEDSTTPEETTENTAPDAADPGTNEISAEAENTEETAPEDAASGDTASEDTAEEAAEDEPGEQDPEEENTGAEAADDAGTEADAEVTEEAEADASAQKEAAEEAQTAATEAIEVKEAKEEAESTYGDYQYEFISGGVEITKYTGKAKSVSIPQKLGGYNVLSVGYRAFYGNKSITAVTFPATVTSIGNQAFQNCASLSKVTLPGNLQSLGYSAFSRTAISSITIPAKLTNTESTSAFANCANLTTVKFASGMTTIPYRILYGCSSVKSITIPDSVREIGDGAFQGTSITKFEGHDKITSIGNQAFQNCASLSKVTLPGNLQSLGYSAFSRTAISSITIPAKLTNTESTSAFANCANLTTVKFASGMTTIPYRILYGCSSVKTVTIPSSVSTVDHGAFNGCRNLSKVIFEGSLAQWKKIDKTYDNEPLLNAKVITLKDNQITAKNATYSYSLTDRSFSLGAKSLGGTLKYSSNNSAVKVDGSGRVTIAARFMGTAKITVSTEGNSTYASARKTVTVAVPVNSSVTSVKSSSAGTVAMTWKKVSTSTGYFVQYSRKSDFSIKKTITINGNSKTTTKLTGLKKGAKYYVRVRTFKTVGGKKYYSSWCAKKAVIVKK